MSTTVSKTGYDVQKPIGVCAVTGQAIEPGEKFMTALRETPLGFERIDVALPAWEQFDRKDVVAYWHTSMPTAHQAKRKLFVDDAVLTDLFERLTDVAEPAKVNFRFVLGLILMRKKLLSYESSSTRDGREVWLMKPKGRDETLELLNPHLNEEQVKDVSTQLGEILNEQL